MSSGQRSFSAPDFLDRLRRDDLAYTPPLTGMVRLARYRTERPRKLPERTGDGGPVIGGGGFRGGGRGEFPGGGSFGGGGWSGWSNWGIWCPEHGGFIELYPSAYLAGYYANWHNSNTGHHASTYEIPLPG